MIRIRGWNETFENADTRKRQRLGWFHCPSGVDSSGYVELMSHGERGIRAFGVFQAICQWSATCLPVVRGSVARSDGTPLSARQIATVLRIPVEVIEDAIELLSSPSVGWIINENKGSASAVPVRCQSGAGDLPVRCHKDKDKDKEKEKDGELTVAVAPCPALEIMSEFDATFGTRSIMTAKRQTALAARWRNPWWRDNWRAALQRAGPSAFLRGANDRGWAIDFEFFLKPDSVAKILEGKYDNRTASQRPATNRAAANEQANADAFAILDAAIASGGQ